MPNCAETSLHRERRREGQPELRGRLFYHWSQDLENREELVRRYANSPIEEMLGLELVQRGCVVLPPVDIGTVHEFTVDPDVSGVLTMQRVFDQYRADFFVTAPFCSGGFVQECDGHDFHEKTKEQAARDKQRDRWFLSRGFSTMRFTGSDIYHDASRCGDEVFQQIEKLA